MSRFAVTLAFVLLACTLYQVDAAARIQGLTSAVPINGAKKTTLVTGYSETGSQTGMKMSAYPMYIKAPDNGNTRAYGIQGQSIKVYPGAVHGYHYGIYMWGVMRVCLSDSKKCLYLHIVDRCDQKDSACITNIKKYGFLVDLQKLAWGAAGHSTGGIYTSGTYSYLFRLSSDTLIKSYGKSTYMLSWLNCYCDYANCNPDNLDNGPYWCPKGRCYLKDSC